MAISLNPLHRFLLFSLLAHSLHTQNLVKADEKLIGQSCRDTEVPALCVQCVKSDPEGRKAKTTVDIASIVINCLSNHAGILVINMSTLASKYSSDKKFVAVCQDCLKGYSGARKNLSTATARLKKGDYDSANHFVIFALNGDYVRSCKTNLRDYELTIVPPEVFYQLGFMKNFLG